MTAMHAPSVDPDVLSGCSLQAKTNAPHHRRPGRPAPPWAGSPDNHNVGCPRQCHPGRPGSPCPGASRESRFAGRAQETLSSPAAAQRRAEGSPGMPGPKARGIRSVASSAGTAGRHKTGPYADGTLSTVCDAFRSVQATDRIASALRAGQSGGFLGTASAPSAPRRLGMTSISWMSASLGIVCWWSQRGPVAPGPVPGESRRRQASIAGTTRPGGTSALQSEPRRFCRSDVDTSTIARPRRGGPTGITMWGCEP